MVRAATKGRDDSDLLHVWEKVLKPVRNVPDERLQVMGWKRPWLQGALTHLKGSV